MSKRPLYHLEQAIHPPRRRVKTVGLNVEGKHEDCPILWSKPISNRETICIVLIAEDPKPLTMAVTLETAGLALFPETDIEW